MGIRYRDTGNDQLGGTRRGVGLGQGAGTVTLQSLILAQSPFAYWPLGDTSGAVADDPVGGFDGAYTGTFTLNQTGIGDGSKSVLFGGGRVSLAAQVAGLDVPFNPLLGTILYWAKWAGAGTNPSPFGIGRDVSNWITAQVFHATGLLRHRYIAGGTTVQADSAVGAIVAGTWFMGAITWDKAANEVKAYLNGTQIGGTQGGLGVWAGALAANFCALFDIDNFADNPWDGNGAHVALFNTVLSQPTLAAIAAPWT